MTAGEDSGDPLAGLRESAVLPEHEFVSHAPVLGRLVAAFRTAWNNVATRWYVQPMREQQTRFNQLSVDQFAALQADLQDVRRDVAALHEWLVTQDREKNEQSHDLGEVAVQLVQLHRRLDHLAAAPPDATAGVRPEGPAL